jgi:hypothetical protein
MRRRGSLLRGSLLAAALLLTASSSTLRAQDFEGIITAKVKGMPGGGDMKTFMKGGKIRVEVTVPGQGAVAIIPDPVAGETYMVMPAQSMYMVIKMSDAERMADSLVRRNAPGSDASMTATGRMDQIADHRCEYYRFQDARSATDICMASGLGMFRGGAAMFGGMPGRGRQGETPPWARELMRKGAFPLKVADTTGAMIWEVIALEQKSLDASLFVPPTNFKRMEMPNFGRPPQ